MVIGFWISHLAYNPSSDSQTNFVDIIINGHLIIIIIINSIASYIQAVLIVIIVIFFEIVF